MNIFTTAEAELKAFVIKVLEDLDLYHPPIAPAKPADPTPGTQNSADHPNESAK